ncbi:MAG: zinc dependent phospholipase C family protein [Acidobacteriota bacterium]|nr:zinc dependent phospholipase C family protein [Acidobacteriota bacterium]
MASSVLILVLLLGSTSQLSSAYSVLTHEQIVDLLWADQIKPLLLQKYPAATEEQLREAHAYAYGGSLIQDIGYYPFGNRHFSDLVHYVRSGDFVVALLDESADLNEYAFALGALSHYASDLAGHPTVNTVVGLQSPKLRAKFGPQVTYGEDAKSHIRTEFGFDLVQISKQRYTSDSYHDFIGFQVSKPVLERAFLKTYGIELKKVFMNLDLSIGTYRYSVSHIIPTMTQVALATKEPDWIKENPSFDRKKFLYNLSRAEYERDWGKGYEKPGGGAGFLALLFRIVPKVGPFKALKFQAPTQETEAMYMKSVNDTVDQYRILLQQLQTREIALANRDLDTGAPTKAGEYAMTDHAYAKLVSQLVESKFVGLTPELQANIVHFYADRNRVIAKKKDREEWQKALVDVDQLKLATTTKEAAATGGGR